MDAAGYSGRAPADPDAERELCARAGERWSGLGSLRPLGRSLKAALLVGERAGAAVTVKKLVDDRPLWRWYFEREVELHQRLSLAPPPTRAPRLLDADVPGGWLLLEHLPGPPLGQRRWADASLDPARVEALVEAQRRLAAWGEGLALAPSRPPPGFVTDELRARLLEDPSAPLAWCAEGLRLGQQLGLLPAPDADAAVDALDQHPRVVFAHGDLLLRNAVEDGPGVALIDWECAGAHPEGWDLGILWANLLPPQRGPVEQAIAGWTPPARRAFWACAAFALVRELKFRGAHTKPRPRDPRERQLRADLARASASLRAA